MTEIHHSFVQQNASSIRSTPINATPMQAFITHPALSQAHWSMDWWKHFVTILAYTLWHIFTKYIPILSSCRKKIYDDSVFVCCSLIGNRQLNDNKKRCLRSISVVLIQCHQGQSLKEFGSKDLSNMSSSAHLFGRKLFDIKKYFKKVFCHFHFLSNLCYGLTENVHDQRYCYIRNLKL